MPRLGFGKKEKREEISGSKPATLLPPPPAPKEIPRRRETREIHRQNEFSEGPSPPLFIKIEKYADLVKEIQKLKSYAVGLRDALDALAEVENELKEGISIAHRALDTFNSIITVLDSKLLRIHGVDESLSIPEEMEDYIREVQNQIDKIRQEIKSIAP